MTKGKKYVVLSIKINPKMSRLQPCIKWKAMGETPLAQKPVCTLQSWLPHFPCVHPTCIPFNASAEMGVRYLRRARKTSFIACSFGSGENPCKKSLSLHEVKRIVLLGRVGILNGLFSLASQIRHACRLKRCWMRTSCVRIMWKLRIRFWLNRFFPCSYLSRDNYRGR